MRSPSVYGGAGPPETDTNYHQMHFGLIGKRLSHSFSKAYFSEKFAALGLPHRYDLYELADIADLPRLLENHPGLVGLNVTVPYKQAVIPYVGKVWGDALAAGALNVLARGEWGWEGYNTDVAGFASALKGLIADSGLPRPDSALVLGTGGASRAAQVGLGQMGVPYRVVGRSTGQDLGQQPYLSYTDLPGRLGSFGLLVQTTPLGQYPDIDGALPLIYSELHPGQLAMDLVYNPAQTRFMALCAAQGCRTQNGLPMLHAQAEAAWQIWQRVCGA